MKTATGQLRVVSVNKLRPRNEVSRIQSCRTETIPPVTDLLLFWIPTMGMAAAIIATVISLSDGLLRGIAQRVFGSCLPDAAEVFKTAG
jgi:hypothetical protein